MQVNGVEFALEEIINSVSLGFGIINPEKYSILYSNRFLNQLMEKGLKVILPNLLEDAIKKDIKMSEISIGQETYGYVFEEYGKYLIFFIKNISEALFLLGLQRERGAVERFNQLFSILRHEIGNPLNIIKLSLGVLREQYKEFAPEKIEEYLNRIMQEAESIEKVLATMKNFLAVGRLSLTKVNLREFIPKTVLFGDELKKSSNISIFLDEIPDVFVKADPMALRQVLVNLIKNSVEAMEKTRGEKIIQVRVHTMKGFARISIYDSGPGIPPEVLKKIFVPFFTTKKNGTGMGLAISKRLVTAMGGHLEIVNASGGALAMVYLPLWKEKNDEK